MKNIVYFILLITILTSLYLEFVYKPNKFKEHFNIKNNDDNDKEKIQWKNKEDTETYDKIDLDIYAELIDLDPKFEFDKIEIKDGKIVKNNYDWEKRFVKNLCNEKCGCVTDNNNLCSYKQGSSIYQCPSFCPKCNKCHFMEKSSMEEKYESMCNKTRTLDEKEKCNKYKELLRISKSYCFFKKTDINNIIEDDKNCELYKSINNINYYDGDDILIRLTFNFKKKDMKKIGNITIDNINSGKNNKEFNIFYKTDSEIYLFLKTDISDVKYLQELIIEGKIFFKEVNKEKTFNKKLLVSILEKNIEQKNNSKPPRDITENKEVKNNFKSYDDDKYQLNYLEDSKFLNCYPVNNHSVYNDVKNKKLGNFEKKNLIDSPITWVERVDIARPWIFTG